MPLPVTALEEAIIREWIRQHQGDVNLIYSAIILTPEELQAEVGSFATELIAMLQAQNAEAQAQIDERNSQIAALGGTP